VHETDYTLLHEIARHGIHVSETLRVALASLDAIRLHHQKFQDTTELGRPVCWDRITGRFELQLQRLHGLYERSVANNARTQNEITLVSRYDMKSK
jgi:hypothetical protein